MRLSQRALRLFSGLVQVKAGGNESLVTFGGSGTGGRCDGAAASAQNWIREAGGI